MDTTVQEKAIAYPTDARPYHVMRGKLVKLAKRSGLELRQSYERVAAGVDQAERLCGGHRIKDVFVDRGYRGHGYQGEATIHICDGNKRKNLSRRLKRLRKRRSAIEPVIGHMKNDGRLGRNYLLGMDGDRMNVILCACGHNFRLLLNRIRRSTSRSSIFVAWLAAFFYRSAAVLRREQARIAAPILSAMAR